MTTQGWSRVLLVIAVAIAAYALALVVAGPTAGRLFDVLGFGMASGRIPEGAARDYVLLIYGVLGSVLVGWMILVAGLAAGPLRRGDRGAWRLLVASTSVWFALDTTFSLASGSWQHALFNVAFLAALGVPLIGWWAAARSSDPGIATGGPGTGPACSCGGRVREATGEMPARQGDVLDHLGTP